jgi:DNA-binding response OmpR family regulator
LLVKFWYLIDRWAGFINFGLNLGMGALIEEAFRSFMDFSNLKHKKVLVVDDFANVRKSIKTMLLDLGFTTVNEAGDGNAASKLMRETKHDLVLCDFNLGKGRDGMRLLEEWRRLKLLSQEAIFVLITGETARDIVISALEFQPDDYLAKPFTMEVLSIRMMRWFERRQILLPLLVSLDKKDWPAVARIARQVNEQHPRYRSAAQKHFVEALIQQDQLTEAENFLYGLLGKRYQCWAQTSLHRIELLQHKHDSAEKGLKAVLVRDPNEMIAYDYLVDALQEQDKDEEVQFWLEEAISRAPRNISRQQKLVQVAQKNLNYQRANQAQRDVLSLATDTMHESLGRFQTYIKDLQHEARSCDEVRKKEIQKDITNAGKRMIDSFAFDQNARLFNKALQVQRSNDSSDARYARSLNELLNQSFDAIDELIPETAVFLAETFYLAERFDDGDEMVRRFNRCFKQQPQVVRVLNALQAEPIPLSVRKEAKKLNSQGIDLYRRQQYSESIQLFERAIILSPRHPGIVLNFVQSHLMQMKIAGKNRTVIEMCLDTIRRLHYLSDEHYQYERYQKLLANLDKL